MQRTVLHVKSADRKRRPRVASGHHDHPPAHGEEWNGALKIRLAQGFPPHVDAVGGKEFYLPIHIFSFVIESEVRAEFAAGLDFLRAAGGRDDARAQNFSDLEHTRSDAARSAI